MSIVTLYIAATLDGYIARPDGNLDWLTSTPDPDQGDYGYEELLSGIEATIMGRKTYEEVLGFGIEWPYKTLASYLVTNQNDYAVKTPNTFVADSNLRDLVGALKRVAKKDIWLIGGGELISAFLREGLLDKMIITMIPKNLGKGVRLFPGETAEIDWKLENVKAFNTGLVNLTYLRK